METPKHLNFLFNISKYSIIVCIVTGIFLCAILNVYSSSDVENLSIWSKSSNISTGKIVYSSDYYQDYYSKNAVDGDKTTYWCTTIGENKWFVINLGKIAKINEIQIKWGKDNYPNDIILFAYNNSKWNKINKFHGNKEWNILDVKNIKSQFLAFKLEKPNALYYSMYELRVISENTSENKIEENVPINYFSLD